MSIGLGLGVSFWISGPVSPTIYLQGGQTIQQGIDGAPSGATLVIPSGLYREQVTVTKPLTLKAQSVAEIRGSDDWSADTWTPGSGIWTSSLTVPDLGSDTQHGDVKTQWREQVFIDGAALTQVAVGTTPVSGQFTLDASRHVVIADNPSGKLIEVTTRQRWVTGTADNVTIQGFTMKHAGTPAQDGAISNNGKSNWTIRDNTLSDAHGRCITAFSGSRILVLNNDVSRAGHLGIGGWQVTSSVIQGNTVHDNNTEGADTWWEAGGIKITESSGTIVSGNTVYDNVGAGIWIDIDCTNMTVDANTVFGNSDAGIVYEISDSGTITNNVSYQNATGIMLSTSDSVEVRNNVVAWNNDKGIFVLDANRGVGYLTKNISIELNYIFADDSAVGSPNIFGLLWYDDNDTSLFDAANNNTGTNNKFYYIGAEGAHTRFAWSSGYTDITAFAATPGGTGSTYLTQTEAEDILTTAGVPLTP